MGTSEQLYADVHIRMNGKPQDKENQVGCQGCAGPLGRGRPRWRPSLLMHINVHDHHCNSFLSGSDAPAMSQNLPSTPQPDFVYMNHHLEPRSVLDCVHILFVCIIGHRLLRGFPRNIACQEPLIVSYFFWLQSLVRAWAGATPLLYGIVRRLLSRMSRVCRGYEVAIYLNCSSDPVCFVAFLSPLFGAIGPISGLPDATGTTCCAKDLPSCYFFFQHSTFCL